METSRPTDTPSLRFADVARRLGAAAHANGLAVPAFRCPPRTAGATRTLRRYPGGTVVSVRLRDRPFPTVVDDMVDGVLAANRVAPPDEARLRVALRAAIDGVLRPAEDADVAGTWLAAPIASTSTASASSAPSASSVATSDLAARAA